MCTASPTPRGCCRLLVAAILIAMVGVAFPAGADDVWGSHVIGGPTAVSEEVVAEVTVLVGQAVRIGGRDRYQTAAWLALGAGPSSVVYVATGENWPDALAGGAAAGTEEGSVLLVRRNSIPEETAWALGIIKPEIIYVLGGPAAVSDSVVDALKAYAGEVSRLSGANRYETAVKVSQQVFDLWTPVRVYVATGENFPDALAGAAAAGFDHAPILLVTRDAVPAVTAAELERLGRFDPVTIVVLGGPAAVSEAVVDQLESHGQVIRIAGANRYGTAAALSEWMWEDWTHTGPYFNPYIASGENWPDALAAGPVAARQREPLLLVRKWSVPQVIAQELVRLSDKW